MGRQEYCRDWRAVFFPVLLFYSSFILSSVESFENQVSYLNPVDPGSVPDPGVLYYKGVYYVAGTTNNDPDAFSLRSSPDLVNYTFHGYAFPNGSKPSWTVSDYWAPEIHRVNNMFHMYYVARDKTGMLCIGLAIASSPLGPWKDLGRPLFRDPSVGSIDPTLYKLDSNGLSENWLVYKSDGNAIQQPTPIWAQQLADDGITLVGNRTQLLVNDLDWEGPLVEAPWVISRNGYFYLFYSANMFNTNRYCVGVARSKTFLGPYEKSGSPILTSNAAFAGPGHCSVVSIDDKDETFIMVYHSWLSGHIDGPNDVRMLLIDPILWENDWPSIATNSPSVSSQTIPRS